MIAFVKTWGGWIGLAGIAVYYGLRAAWDYFIPESWGGK